MAKSGCSHGKVCANFLPRARFTRFLTAIDSEVREQAIEVAGARWRRIELALDTPTVSAAQAHKRKRLVVAASLAWG